MIDQSAWYTRHASRYDKDFFTPRGSAVKRRFASLAALVGTALAGARNERWLEIGSGSGVYTAAVAGLGPASLTATDISMEMLQAGRDRHAAFGWHACVNDASALPFADASFDLVWSFACLHHIRDTPSALREVSRVLRPTGGLCIMEANPLFPLNILLALLRPVERGMLTSRPARWIREARMAKLELAGFRCGSFFPSWPDRASKFYTATERILERLPGIRALGIQHYYFFRKC